MPLERRLINKATLKKTSCWLHKRKGLIKKVFHKNFDVKLLENETLNWLFLKKRSISVH